jgi:hypothetical protein
VKIIWDISRIPVLLVRVSSARGSIIRGHMVEDSVNNDADSCVSARIDHGDEVLSVSASAGKLVADWLVSLPPWFVWLLGMLVRRGYLDSPEALWTEEGCTLLSNVWPGPLEKLYNTCSRRSTLGRCDRDLRDKRRCSGDYNSNHDLGDSDSAVTQMLPRRSHIG